MEIVRVEASHQAYPFRGYFKSLGTAGHQVVTVRIVSDDGSEGWGQSVFPVLELRNTGGSPGPYWKILRLRPFWGKIRGKSSP